MGRKPKTDTQPKVYWKNRNILIIDNVDANFEILKNALEPTYARIEQARSGYEGIRMCLENKKIDVVLVNTNLPGLSGLDITKELRVLKPDIVIIGHSAFLTHTKEQCVSAGMDDFFIKPIPPTELIQMIRNALVKRNKRV